MRFSLIDRIVELEPGERITAVKALTMAEEYLADHFPQFPVMPGVLMLESLTQAGAWLVRASEDFAHSIVVLKQVNNAKYAQFVEPGQTLTVTAELLKPGRRRGETEGLWDGGRADHCRRPADPGLLQPGRHQSAARGDRRRHPAGPAEPTGIAPPAAGGNPRNHNGIAVFHAI